MPTLDKFMKLRVTSDEHAFLLLAARAQGKTLSAFIRDAVGRDVEAILAHQDASERKLEVDEPGGVTRSSAS